ncbi:MAG: diaminobutyrate--2-oxoglutarate transaminase [Alphaproteobacteria bacterium]
MTMTVFEELESNVRSYSRSFPKVFGKAKGHLIRDKDGREYVDFFAGAGALNYGHNPDDMKAALIDYIQNDGVSHGLDMATEAKETFLTRFREVILEPRGMKHKVLFPGPTGTNTVESALKLARLITGRDTIVSFTNAFHGMTLGALAATGNAMKREGAGLPLNGIFRLPFDGYMGEGVDTLDLFETMLADSGSGLGLPAAVIVETVQGEGGINAARFEWLKRLETICREWKMLLIVDDIQAGCGRTGAFFSFEQAGLDPDIICLSKSISGYGLPMALTLVRPEHDIFKPGQHNGTFRGNSLAFVTATVALERWKDGSLEKEIAKKSETVFDVLNGLARDYPRAVARVKGRGLMCGLEMATGELSGAVAKEAFKRGLLVETAGSDDEVVKLFPPVTIEEDGLKKGLDILKEAVEAVAVRAGLAAQAAA